jgi:hypothetical protein
VLDVKRGKHYIPEIFGSTRALDVNSDVAAHACSPGRHGAGLATVWLRPSLSITLDKVQAADQRPLLAADTAAPVFGLDNR